MRRWIEREDSELVGDEAHAGAAGFGFLKFGQVDLDHMETALPLIGIGSALRLQGKLAESDARLREALAILRKNPAQRDRTADAAAEHGLTLRAMGRSAEAAVLLQESYDILLKAYGDRHPLTRQARARLGLN